MRPAPLPQSAADRSAVGAAPTFAVRLSGHRVGLRLRVPRPSPVPRHHARAPPSGRLESPDTSTSAATAVSGHPIAMRATPSHPVWRTQRCCCTTKRELNTSTTRTSRGRRPRRPCVPTPVTVVRVDPAPDVADDRATNENRHPEYDGPEQRHPDAEQEVALGRADDVGDQRADPHTDEAGDRGLDGLAPD